MARRSKKRFRRYRFRRFNFRKALFVLPNLFTISSVFCGFYAIVLCSSPRDPHLLYQATLAIFFGLFFDSADGRVARLTRTQSEFGVQLDSLADMVTFGVAPALLMYQWSLYEFGIAGATFASLHVACAAIRLARFNVIAMRSSEDSNTFFTGLPTPLAACVLVSLVLASNERPAHEVVEAPWVGALIIMLALLMVSNVPYRSFKKVVPNKRNVLLLMATLTALTLLTLFYRLTVTLAMALFFYVLVGLAESFVKLVRRPSSVQTSNTSVAPPASHEPGTST